MTYKINWNMSACDEDCTECVNTCPGNVLEKDNQGLLTMKAYSACQRCESCYMGCPTGAITPQFVQDEHSNLSMIEYIN